jgi:hypothetical protein
MEYETELLGQKIKVHIDDSIIKKDKDALNRIGMTKKEWLSFATRVRRTVARPFVQQMGAAYVYFRG